MISERWKHFHQGAGVGVRRIGPAMEAAFAQAAMALTAAKLDPIIHVQG